MSGYLDEAQIQQRYEAAMGKPVGDIFTALWRELLLLQSKWHEYATLFGTDEETVIKLNSVAPHFFGTIQSLMLDDVLLHIARMTDQAKVAGHKTLSIYSLVAILAPGASSKITEKFSEAITNVAFCRKLRNSKLAHNDLEVYLDTTRSDSLPSVTRAKIRAAIGSLGAFLGSVEEHFGLDASDFEYFIPSLGGANNLLEIIDLGLSARRKRRDRLA